MMIDLPAPVSPVKMISPGSKSSSSWSMMAKFWMRSSVSMLPRQLDARQAGVDDRGGDEQENALEDQPEKAEGNQVENDDRQRRPAPPPRQSVMKERAGAVLAGGQAHRFGDDDPHRGGGEENDDEAEEAGDAADQAHQQAGKERTGWRR